MTSSPSRVGFQTSRAPHAIGIDDGPFVKHVDASVMIVGAVSSGPSQVEGFLTARLPVDGDQPTAHLADWIRASRFAPLIRVIFLRGITIAGLSVIDLPDLAARTRLPVIAASKTLPEESTLGRALDAAGFADRKIIVARAGPAFRWRHLVIEAAGIAADEARHFLDLFAGKSDFPEPVRLAHLVARAVVDGESKGS
jgi:endonuclease V-like protein UPF0215 family